MLDKSCLSYSFTFITTRTKTSIDLAKEGNFWKGREREREREKEKEKDREGKRKSMTEKSEKSVT